jgi:hypothetical protein
MPKLIFDIETIGEDYDSLDETTKEVLTRWLKKESVGEGYEVALEEMKAGLGFSPLTGEVIAIGMLDYDQDKGAVYYQAPEQDNKEFEEGGIKFKQMTEAEMLKAFWEAAEKYSEFISFNGRSFDAPFLMVRSAINKIKPTKDLMSNRYLASQKFGALHVDLLDQFSFYGTVRRKGNLHLWSRAFSIKSPKAQGITGDDVGRLFQEKKYLEIAKYNVGDLKATRDLYKYWSEYIRM